MKTMKKQMMTLAAVLMAGAAVTSCSSDNEMDSPKAPAAKAYTMTVSATKGGDETRALSLSGEGDKTLNATWATTENVYVKKGSDWATGSLKPQTAGASTTLKGTLSGVTIAANDELTLQFPRSGALDYTGQVGTLEDIAAKYDYATATVTATVSDNKVTASAASFVNQQAVVKFTLVDKADGTTKLSPTALTINDGTSDIVTLTSIPAETYTTNGEGVLYVALPAVSSKPITLTATVGSDTYTLTTSSAKSFANGSYYRVTAKMASVPTGALSGQFTVGMNGTTPVKVYFSKGNLQYIGSAATPYWKFAEHQYDYLGTTTGQNNYTTNVDRDLFGWSTSGKTFASGYGSAYQPYATSTTNTTYGPTDGTSGLTGTYADGDWGVNAISNGGNEANSGWRTLTKDEWRYVFGTNSGDERSGATVGVNLNARFTEAIINTEGTPVNGIILFPDGATFAADEATWGSINGSSNWETKCTTAQWTALEAKGCVFLPAAGYREGTSVSDVGSKGSYWSSTANGSDGAFLVNFYLQYVAFAERSDRFYGYSVRLVRNVPSN